MTFDDEETLEPLSAPPAAALADTTGYLLARAFIRARTLGGAAMPKGRQPRDFAVLAVLHERGPVSQRVLGEILGINRTIMVKLIDSLEQAGLVRRERDPADRRSYAVTPTEGAAEAYDQLTSAAIKGEAALTANLTGEEAQRLNTLLRRLLPEAARPPEALAGRLGYLLAVTHLQLRERGSQALRPLGLETRKFGLMSTLAHVEPCSQQELAAEMGVSGPAVVGLIDQMHSKGLIERERNREDRRQHVLRLTQDGRERLTAARAVVDGIQADIAEHLGGPAELAELNALLAKLL